jgi:hypothetical protein
VGIRECFRMPPLWDPTALYRAHFCMGFIYYCTILQYGPLWRTGQVESPSVYTIRARFCSPCLLIERQVFGAASSLARSSVWTLPVQYSCMSQNESQFLSPVACTCSISQDLSTLRYICYRYCTSIVTEFHLETINSIMCKCGVFHIFGDLPTPDHASPATVSVCRVMHCALASCAGTSITRW